MTGVEAAQQEVRMRIAASLLKPGTPKDEVRHLAGRLPIDFTDVEHIGTPPGPPVPRRLRTSPLVSHGWPARESHEQRQARIRTHQEEVRTKRNGGKKGEPAQQSWC